MPQTTEQTTPTASKTTVSRAHEDAIDPTTSLPLFKLDAPLSPQDIHSARMAYRVLTGVMPSVYLSGRFLTEDGGLASLRDARVIDFHGRVWLTAKDEDGCTYRVRTDAHTLGTILVGGPNPDFVPLYIAKREAVSEFLLLLYVEGVSARIQTFPRSTDSVLIRVNGIDGFNCESHAEAEKVIRFYSPNAEIRERRFALEAVWEAVIPESDLPIIADPSAVPA